MGEPREIAIAAAYLASPAAGLITGMDTTAGGNSAAAYKFETSCGEASSRHDPRLRSISQQLTECLTYDAIQHNRRGGE